MTRLILTLCLLAGAVPATALAAQQAQRPDSSRFFFRFAFSFDPTQVMQGDRDAETGVALAREQRGEVTRAVTRASARFRPLTLELARRQAVLDSLLAASEVDEDGVMAAFDRVVVTETELKRLQMRLLLETYGTLNPDQRRELLRRMRGNDD